MDRGTELFVLFLAIFLSVGSLLSIEIRGNTDLCLFHPAETFSGLVSDKTIINSSGEVDQLNRQLRKLLTIGDFAGSKTVVEKIIKQISAKKLHEKTLSESYYLVSIYYSYTYRINDAIRYLNQCIKLTEKSKEFDERYAKALYNLGIMYNRIGDFRKHKEYSLRSLKIEKELYGISSPLLMKTYISLATAYIELQEYDKALEFSNAGFEIAFKNEGNTDSSDLFNLFTNFGVIYNRLADYSKAQIYLSKAESIYLSKQLNSTEYLINLMNSLGINYSNLGLLDKSHEYYEKGITLALSNNSYYANNLINSYAVILGNESKSSKGDSLLSEALSRARNSMINDSLNYFEILNNYAEYLREYKINNKKSLEYYDIIMSNIKRFDSDLFFKNSIITGYSLSLAEAGESEKALGMIQSLLFPGEGIKSMNGSMINPGIESLKVDRQSLKILKAKHKILWDIYSKTNEYQVLKAASGTSELVIAMIEKLRINMSEEDSRLILGDKFRVSYIDAISDFGALYKNTGNISFLEKAFEYSEKSKVAGLLTSTRELEASEFHIPVDISDMEKGLQRDIILLNERISQESDKENPDSVLVNLLKENILSSIRSRDSLLLVFEKQYPDYYAVKYNTKVADIKDIPEIIGRRENYLNYVVSDTSLYIFVVNRKHTQLLTVPVDSSFQSNLREFRVLLSNPAPVEGARASFEKYLIIGYDLYKKLLAPVRPYLISDEILISPDNLISYIPFEALPQSPEVDEKMLYRNLSYVMDDLNISYTYSATFLAESLKKDYKRSNNLIAFAPGYPEPIDIQTVLKSRQYDKGALPDLPFARLEAKFVVDITGGTLFENQDALESVFKTEAGKYDIIHLAMHTLVNENDPMQSTLIFSKKDSTEDGYLKTYEIYGMPLKAKMVVLSSCNTGSGRLSSGEGILSLARGFIYSGSQSVVMSMWEIEDKSATDIVKMFYENLKKGNTKSAALRNARIAYLKNADQMRSHPYFWSSLVVYGDNVPIYYPKYLIYTIILIAISILLLLALYLRKRKYS